MTVEHAAHGITAGAKKVSVVTFTKRGYRFAVTVESAVGGTPLWYRTDLHADGRAVAALADTFARTGHGLVATDPVFFERDPDEIGQAFTATDVGDLFTAVGHGFVAASSVRFTGASLPTGIVAGTTYYVIAAGLTVDDFQVSATVAGAAVVLTTDGSGTVYRDLPATIAADTVYYVIAGGLTADVFKVSTTSGGGALDITAIGAGVVFRAPSGDNSSVCPSGYTVDHFETAGKKTFHVCGIAGATEYGIERVR